MRSSTFAFTPALLLAACGGLPPTETPTPTGLSPAAEHCGVIITPETWTTADSPHRVTCDVEIEGGGAVTVEAGAQVSFAAQTRLKVGVGGGAGILTVAGTAEAPVRFAGEGDATWYGLQIAAAAGAVTLDHLAIEDAGDLPGGQPYLIAPVAAFGAEVAARGLAIDGADTCGLVLAEGARLAAGSTALHVAGGEGFAACVDPAAAASLPTADSTYGPNGTDGVLLLPDEPLTTAASWADLGVPYVVPTDLHLTGSLNAPAVLTLAAGVHVSFYGDAGLFIGEPGGATAGGLVTLGTAEAPVRLDGWTGDGRGAWDGIVASAGTREADFDLRHTTLSGGGKLGYAGGALAALGTGPRVEVVTVEGSRYAGFKLADGARFQAGSQGLTVRDCVEVGRIESAEADSVPELGAALTGNDLDQLLLTTGGGVGVLTRSATWGDLGVPYRVLDRVEIDGTAQAPAVLTVEAGVEVRMDNDRSIVVGGSGAAGLVAAGTEAAPVVFTADASLSPGAWRAIYFAAETVDASASLTHVEVGYAGGEGFYRRQGAIIVEDASPTLTDVWIHHSACNGVAVYGETSAPVLTDVTYEDVGCVGYYEEP